MLTVEGLTVEFDTLEGVVRAVDDVSFSVAAGEVLGIVGESGSGKSVTARSILRILPTPPARHVGGSITFNGTDLVALSERQMRSIRGRRISMVPQDPIPALNPTMKVGSQLIEAIRAHDSRISRRAARDRAIELLRSVRVPNPEARVGEYPHQFSGGMAQRVLIALAIANQPQVIIADEPTTALDVTVQAQVMATLRKAQLETSAAMILITHDLGLVAEVADRVVVMYAGRVVEQGSVWDVFDRPSHPYTVGLLGSVPRVDVREEELRSIPGQPPRLNERLPGCAFLSRCQLSNGREPCATIRPLLQPVREGQWSACHYFSEVSHVPSAEVG